MSNLNQVSKNDDQLWYLDKKYDSFWKNYLYSMNFMRQPSDSILIKNLPSNFAIASVKANQAAHLATINALNKDLTLTNLNNVLQSNETTKIKNHNYNIKTEESDIEFEISNELIEFYEESIKYKIEKKENEKKRLKQLASGEITDYVPGEQVKLTSNTISIYAPIDRVGVKREQELQLLYGEKASLIHLMETNAQMKHDKNFDIYQPVYWPSFPLKLNFK